MNRFFRNCRNYQIQKLIGLVLLSAGLGMLLVIFIPSWGFILAGLMVIAGFWMLAYC